MGCPLLLWAGQGVTDPGGLRTAPAEGAVCPLEVYAAAAEGTYRHSPANHALVPVAGDDRQQAPWQAAVRQDPVRQAPAVVDDLKAHTM